MLSCQVFSFYIKTGSAVMLPIVLSQVVIYALDALKFKEEVIY